MAIKYQIFVSSTFVDLVEERQDVSRSILDLGHIPAGMELFPSVDVDQLSYIKKVIDECDYYILIIGARYGSLDEEGISYTQREYEYAVETGKTVLAFVHRNIDELPIGKSDKDEAKRKKLDKFIDDVRTGRIVQTWSDQAELSSKAIIALTKAFAESPQKGWVRADTVPSHSTMSDVIKYRERIDELERRLKNSVAITKPVYADVAGLDTSVSVRYSYRYKRYSDYFDGHDEIATDYRNLLVMIAPAGHNPATLFNLRSALAKGLKERLGVERDRISIEEAFMQDAALHLVALKMLKMWSSKSEKGNFVTGYQLTELGVKVWQESSYVRKTEAG